MSTPEAIKKQRGKRIKGLRKQTHLSRRAFALKHGVPTGTMQYWEDGNFGGLSEDGAYRLVKAFAREGFQCTPEWFLYGIGETPKFVSPIPEKQPSGELPAELKGDPLSQELKLFYQLHRGAIHEMITNNDYTPLLRKGDYVAGVQCFGTDIQAIVNQECIIKTIDGKTHIGRLTKQLKANDSYQLQNNLSSTAKKQLTLKQADIISAAAIIWIRRQEP